MTNLSIEVLDVLPEPFAVAPHLLFRLRLSETSGAVVHALALRAQVMVHPQRRPYGDDERAGLVDLFGGSERWFQTLKPFLWAHASTLVQGFQGVQEVDLPVACTYDFEVTASKYLQALREGEVPLELLFGGTVFTRGSTGFAVEQLPWSLQASCRMPVATWGALMDQWFPGSGWIRLDREALDALVRYRSARGLTSWEQTVTALLEGQEVASP
ncbi:MAG: DUF6084 family protein [Mycobacteriales bacterium]